MESLKGIDVFVTVFNDEKIDDDVWIAWYGMPDAVLHILRGSGMSFQRDRRIQAEKKSTSDIYVLADSDCLVIDSWKVFLEHGVRMMKLYGKFGILSPMPSNHTIYPWTPEDYRPYTDPWIMEHIDAGGIRFVRKGVMPEVEELWRPQQENRVDTTVERGWKYDRDHCEQIRERGYCVGFMKGLKFRHLGVTTP